MHARLLIVLPLMFLIPQVSAVCPVGCTDCVLDVCNSCDTGAGFQALPVLNICVCELGSFLPLDGTTCSSCNTALSGCANCSSADVCDSCIPDSNFELDTVNNVCVCAVGYFFNDQGNSDPADDTCEACVHPATECISATFATACHPDFQLTQEGTCVCPDGEFSYTSDIDGVPQPLSCAPCDSNCATCVDANTCLTCNSDSGYFFNEIPQDGLCTCSDGFFLVDGGDVATVSGDTCQACNSLCATCADGTSCLTCDTSLDFESTPSGGLCNVCTDGHWFSDGGDPLALEAGDTCEDCLFRCDTCSDGVSCDSCNSDEYFVDVNPDEFIVDCQCDSAHVELVSGICYELADVEIGFINEDASIKKECDPSDIEITTDAVSLELAAETITYAWSYAGPDVAIGDALAANIGASFVFPTASASEGDHVIGVEVSVNGVLASTDELTITIEVGDTLDVDVSPSAMVEITDSDVEITAIATTSCPDATVAFNWVAESSRRRLEHGEDPNSILEDPSSPSFIVGPSNVAPCLVYQFTVTASVGLLESTPKTVYVWKDSAGVVAAITGAVSPIDSSTDINLSGESSQDLDHPDGDLSQISFAWSCVWEDGTTCLKADGTNLVSGEIGQTLDIASADLVAGHILSISLTVTSCDNTITDSATVDIIVGLDSCESEGSLYAAEDNYVTVSIPGDATNVEWVQVCGDPFIYTIVDSDDDSDDSDDSDDCDDEDCVVVDIDVSIFIAADTMELGECYAFFVTYDTPDGPGAVFVSWCVENPACADFTAAELWQDLTWFFLEAVECVGTTSELEYHFRLQGAVDDLCVDTEENFCFTQSVSVGDIVEVEVCTTDGICNVFEAVVEEHSEARRMEKIPREGQF